MIEVCAAVEPFRQPSPARNPGGDSPNSTSLTAE